MASGKRQATTDLNHDNWNQEDEPEERGIFRIASDDELKSRVIKKARRKVISDDADESGSTSTSIFKGFSGFGKTASATSGAGGAFSFLSKIPAVNAASNSSSASTAPTFSFGIANNTKTNETKSTLSNTSPLTTNNGNHGKVDEKDSSFKAAANESSKTDTYYANLKNLNQSVSNWIKTHVDKNPLCILTPIFKDYEKHLNDLQKDETKAPGISNNIFKSSSQPEESSVFSSFKFSSTNTSTNNNNSPPKTEFLTPKPPSPRIVAKMKKPEQKSIFGNAFSIPQATTTSNGDNKDVNTAPSFSFKSTTTPPKVFDVEPKGFSFTAGAKPFVFGNVQAPVAAAPPTATTNNQEDDEEDQPPKVEFKQVVEEDAVYSKKCKVYAKKDGNFVERGVGTLYLKPVKDSEKTQLLVRADTNLGNILVNLILNSVIPTKRMGKNNVMLVCLPTPDEDKPTPILFRVKTGEEADELFETIEKHKK